MRLINLATLYPLQTLVAQACDKSAYRDVLKMVSDTSEVKLRIRERYVVQVRERAKLNLVGDKMNLTVRLGKLFYESSCPVPNCLGKQGEF